MNMHRPLDVADTVALQTLISRYAWALDTADLATLADLFTADARLRDTSGTVHEGRDAVMAYFGHLVRLPAFRGRQHHIDHALFEPGEDGVHCRAYWTVTKWQRASGSKALELTGHSLDRFVATAQGWRFAERLLYYWTDEDCPWHPAGKVS